MPKMIHGRDLTQAQRGLVLQSFLYRWTHENARASYGGRCPACVQQQSCGGQMLVAGKPWHEHHLPLVSDVVWLVEHAFAFTNDGKHLNRQVEHCQRIAYSREEYQRLQAWIATRRGKRE